MSEGYRDVNSCEYCHRIPVSDYNGAPIGDNCIEMERTTDLGV